MSVQRERLSDGGPWWVESKMQPALTADEWEDFFEGQNYPRELSAHAAAATRLYGQPFGFTREDVVAIREHARAIDSFEDDAITWWNGLADRIEALLPPEK